MPGRQQSNHLDDDEFYLKNCYDMYVCACIDTCLHHERIGMFMAHTKCVDVYACVMYMYMCVKIYVYIHIS